MGHQNAQNLFIVNPIYLGFTDAAYNYQAFEALASRAEAMDILHKTLGHIHEERVINMIKSKHIKWDNHKPPPRMRKHGDPCIACALAKSKRQPDSGRIRVPLEPGSLTYVDVWGPCEVSSLIHENQYTIGFIDAATKRAWLYQSKKKSDILDCIKDYYVHVIAKRRVSHGLKEFIIQSDNGECRSDKIIEYLNSVGGDLWTCCAYTPEIMAFIERLWGIINSMATSMLAEKGLPSEYWDFAQNYALDIYNNIPPSKTPRGQTPKSPNEKYYGVNQDISLDQIFGCRAFAHIPKQIRTKNLNPRATQGFFIGLDRVAILVI